MRWCIRTTIGALNDEGESLSRLSPTLANIHIEPIPFWALAFKGDSWIFDFCFVIALNTCCVCHQSASSAVGRDWWNADRVVLGNSLHIQFTAHSICLPSIWVIYTLLTIYVYYGYLICKRWSRAKLSIAPKTEALWLPVENRELEIIYNDRAAITNSAVTAKNLGMQITFAADRSDVSNTLCKWFISNLNKVDLCVNSMNYLHINFARNLSILSVYSIINWLINS